MRRGIASAVVGLALTAGLLLAPSAQATFHLMKIREVATNPAGADSAFIELQMFAPGQNLVGGHAVTFYTADGSVLTTLSLPANVANGESQRTILIGDTAAAGSPDVSYPMLSDAVQTYGTAGAACFDTVDCVSWGAFTGAAGLPSPTGTPAPAISNGSSLERSITRGCQTLLEDGDDTNDSAADFQLSTPTPRNNGVTPTELPCATGGDAPETTITKAPPKKTEKTKAKLKFASSVPGSTFECKLDKEPFEDCAKKVKYRRLDLGKHKFKVRAVDPEGNADPTPAKAKWKVVD